METRFRTDYAGEFVVIQSRWAGGRKEENREWIANPIENQHISGRAACISGTVDQERFDYTRLQRHRGGLLGSLKLQTYGVGDIASQMRLDFCVETRRDQLVAIIETEYQVNNVVYTTARNCIQYPGEFYLIPNNPQLLDLVTILYLAAFDGHKEIFMLGYHQETPVDNPHWINQVRTVMDAYPGTIFWMIGESTNMPDAWMEADNSKTMTYREWVSYCDVG
jgi:hypothetical protein